MMTKVLAVFIATILSLGTTASISVSVYAQNMTDQNITSEEQPVENLTATQLPIIPPSPVEETEEPGPGPVPFPPAPSNDTAAETIPEAPAPQNLTEAKDQVIGYLDTAEANIEDARDLINSLQEQIQEIEEGEAAEEVEEGEAAVNETEEIITEANETAEEIVDTIEEEITNDTGTIDDIANVTDDVIDNIEDAIEGNDNATAEAAENITDEVIDIVENVTADTDNSTAETQVDTALVRLLTGLVNAQDVNPGLAQEAKDELRANLLEAIADFADSTADAIRDNDNGGE